MKRGSFISIEGIDGAGKRTLTTFIKKYLDSHKLNVTKFEYPDYSSIWGKIIDDYLHGKIEITTEEQFFLYLTDILKDQPKFNNLLNNGDYIISDRYFASTVAFQCAKGFDYNKALSIIESMDMIIPDLTIFVHIQPELASQRKYVQKGLVDRHEKDIVLLNNANYFYGKMINENIISKNWIILDGSQKKETLENFTKKIIDKVIDQNQ